MQKHVKIPAGELPAQPSHFLPAAALVEHDEFHALEATEHARTYVCGTTRVLRKAAVLAPGEDGPDFDFGAAAMLTTSSSGKEILVAGQKSGEVHAIDPDTGTLSAVGSGVATGTEAISITVTDALE